ncbi:MAG: HAD family hydrolase [Succinivibrio sp.]
MSLALFDMDGTLIDGDTNDMSFICYEKMGFVTKDAIKKLDSLEELFYKGTLDIREFVVFASKHLVNMHPILVNEALKQIVEGTLLKHVKKGALERIEFHKNRGDTMLIVTSTMDYLASRIAKALNMDGCIAAPMEIVDGRITGRLTGTVPYQEDKVTRVKEYAKEHNLSLDDCYGYGDSINDLPMLKMCAHRFAVDPNEVLLNSPEIKDLEVVHW